MPQSEPRVLVIALSEATLDLIVPWAKAGRLPTFERLMHEGSWGPLRSQIPLITPQLWGTIATGHSPGRHGAFDFWQRGPDGKFREITGADLKERPIWSLLSERGVPCGVVNVPFTYPPQPVRGFMISGQDAPGAHRSIACPPTLFDDLVARFGRYRLKDIFPGGRQKSDYLTLIEEDTARQATVLEHLVANHPWRFFLTFFSASAMAQHYFWADMESDDAANPFREVVPTAYRCLDAAVGRLVAAAGPETTVCVISECGAGRLQSGVQINACLAREGFLTWKRPPGESSNAGDRGGFKQIWSRVAGWRKRVQRHLPAPLFFWLNRTFGALARERLRSYAVDSGIAWDRTQAFSRGKEGDIFVNLQGRDPQGIVAPGPEYERVTGRIIERLEALVDPETGERPVVRVHRAADLYAGPMLPWAPDLVIEWRGNTYMPTEDEGDRQTVFVPRWREYMAWPTTGSHRVDGILLCQGPGVARGRRIEGARIADLVPTWLSLLQQPVPSDLPGRVLAELCEPVEARMVE
jgi:predicted AlkP superfamily phosphohydrolase/phosphomutase